MWFSAHRPPFHPEVIGHPRAPVAHLIPVLGTTRPGGYAVTPVTSRTNIGRPWSSHQTTHPPPYLPLVRLGLTALESLRMPEARSVVVYSRKGCHLCELVKESLSKLSRRGGFTWREIDVDLDNELRRQFNDEVPVVFIDGRKAFKYRMDEQEFLRKLAS